MRESTKETKDIDQLLTIRKNMENNSNRIVVMRLFANWETDRAAANVISRIFTVSLTRLTLTSFPENIPTLVFTIKLQGNKRMLRSNDFTVSVNDHLIDVDLDITLTIQYPHFLKRKANMLQVLLQRRKRYKNRQIPGYKTIAIGSINMAEALQSNNLREITLLGFRDKEGPSTHGVCKGKLYFASCQSQASSEIEKELSVQKLKDKDLESDGDEYSSSDAQSDNEQDVAEIGSSGVKQRLKIREVHRQTIANRKNLKQRLVSLLKKFKVPEDVAEVTSRGGVDVPTAQELESFIAELDNLSDSDPEMVMDNLSIVSNPRPGLQPYFTTSHEKFLNTVDDREVSEESGEEWSSDAEYQNDTTVQVNSETPLSANGKSSITEAKHSCTDPKADNSATVASLCSQTVKSVDNTTKVEPESSHHPKFDTVSQWISLHLRDDDPWNLSVPLWICSFADTPFLAAIDLSMEILDCSCFNDCRLLISSVVAKIQKLFCVVAPPWSSIGRLLAALDGRQNTFRDIFERSAHEVQLNELKSLFVSFQSLAEHSRFEIPIGEAMLHLHNKPTNDTQKIFVPFLSEIRIGHHEDDIEVSASTQRTTDDIVSSSSPPASPHSHRSDPQDVQVEYWTISNPTEACLSQVMNSSGLAKRDNEGVKCSLRSTFRSLIILRKPYASLLNLKFVKEKRKDKVLQKLGMKKGQRSDVDTYSSSQTINNVTRAICSSKHHLEGCK